MKCTKNRPDPDTTSLYKAIHDGDEVAFATLYIKAVDSIVNFVKVIVGDEDEAKEIAQDVFAYIWENRESINADRKLESYLFKVAKNTALKLIRKRRIHDRFYSDQLFTAKSSELPPDSTVISKETEIILKHVLNSMPSQRRKVFELCRFEGLSHEEIAKRLNISPHTVNRHMTLALKDLREAIVPILLFILLM